MLREAFDRRGEGEALELYFGATSGDVFGSPDAGATLVHSGDAPAAGLLGADGLEIPPDLAQELAAAELGHDDPAEAPQRVFAGRAGSASWKAAR